MAQASKATLGASSADYRALRETDQLAHTNNLLFRFTDGLYRAESLAEIYEVALDAITEGLDCARASILMADDDDVMRFVAWRGLSDTYRAAVEGHSPWKVGTREADIICIEDISLSHESDDIKSVVKMEDICGLSFIPLMLGGTLAGKFMTYHDVARLFTEQDRQLAMTIARQLSFAIEKNRAEDNAARIEAIVANSDDVIVSKDLDGNIVSWNEAASRLFGYSAAEVLGKSGAMLFPDDRADEEPRILAKIRAGEKIEAYETVRKCRDGRLVDMSLSVSPIRDLQGRVVGASKIARDITPKTRAIERQRLLLREMDHRVKNLFSVAGSLVQLCARRATSVDELGSKIVDRLAALARAHSLTMTQDEPTAEAGSNKTPLQPLLSTILNPFDDSGDSEARRILISGEDRSIGTHLVTSVAMLFYELATNAAKYGSLSVPQGHVSIEITEQAEGIALLWKETGGPGIDGEAVQNGFGNSLINASASQLGSAERLWEPDGLAVRVTIATKR